MCVCEHESALSEHVWVNMYCGTENEYVCMYVSASPTMELQEHATGSRSQLPPYVVLGIQSPNSQFYLFFSKFTNFFFTSFVSLLFHILELNIYFL